MNRLYDIMGYAGALMLLIGALLQFLNLYYAPFIYTIGAVLFAYVQIVCNTYNGTSYIVKRLRRQQIAGAILLVVAGFMMIFLKHNEWIACLTCAAVFELYTAFRIPSEIDKQKK